MVLTPFVGSGENAHIVTGICRRCADQSDEFVIAAAMNAVREIYPSGYVSGEPGNA